MEKSCTHYILHFRNMYKAHSTPLCSAQCDITSLRFAQCDITSLCSAQGDILSWGQFQ